MIFRHSEYVIEGVFVPIVGIFGIVGVQSLMKLTKMFWKVELNQGTLWWLWWWDRAVLKKLSTSCFSVWQSRTASSSCVPCALSSSELLIFLKELLVSKQTVWYSESFHPSNFSEVLSRKKFIWSIYDTMNEQNTLFIRLISEAIRNKLLVFAPTNIFDILFEKFDLSDHLIC